MTCILGLIGVVCVMQPNIDILNFFSIWGLLSGFAVAFSQVLYGLSTEEERNDVNLFYLLFFTSLLSFIPLTISYWTAELPFTFFKLPFLQMGALALLFILMGITTIGNQFLRGVAYQYAKPSSLAPFIYLSIVISGFIDWIYYHETLNFTAYIGVILVIYATVMRLIYTQRV